MRRVLPVVNVLSLVFVIFGVTMVFPLAFSFWYHDEAIYVFDEAVAITTVTGGALWLATRRFKRELQVRDGFLLVVLAWTLLPAFGTLPLLLFIKGLSFTDAYFEAVSGLTTTGATVLSGLDGLPPSINIWRGQMVWMGGMGLIVLAVAILPLLGVGGRQMLKAETPGPMKDSKLTPRIAETAKGLWYVYAGISVACLAAFKLAGMTWLDAWMHTFSTMGLGGFSSHDASFGYWDSPLIEAITIGFMLIAGMNFATHFLAWRHRGPAPYRHDPEARWFLAVTGYSVVLVTLYLLAEGTYTDVATALRYAAFNTVSIATTTGFANTDYNLWPLFAPLWMLFLSSFATCSGSTGGGIKMIRAQVLYKQVFGEFTRTIHPSAVVQVKIAGHPVPPQIVSAVLGFGFVYMVCIVTLTLALAFTGLDAVTAFSAVVASINNTGPGLNQVGPATTFAVLTDFQTWVCTLAMLLGRLELFTLLILFSPAFWRK